MESFLSRISKPISFFLSFWFLFLSLPEEAGGLKENGEDPEMIKQHL